MAKTRKPASQADSHRLPPIHGREIPMLPVEKLVPLARNARTHDDAQVAQIAASIREFGFTNPVLVDERDTIIAGHGRVLAARKLGMTEVPCLRLCGLSDAQKRAYVIADNRLALNAGWDDAMLRVEIADLTATGFDTSLLGFDGDELADLLKPAGGGGSGEGCDAEAKVDQAAALREKWGVEAGHLWQLGEHRIICGDSTERATYDRLIAGDLSRPVLLVTDPPYGVAYQDAGKSRIQGDLTQAAFPIALACSVAVLDDNGRIYVFCASDQIAMADRVFSHHLSMRPRLIVWAKESFILRHNGYHSQFEMVCYGWKGAGGGPKHWHGDRKQSDVWQVARDGDRVHPTQKPVEVCCIPIRNSSAAGDVVLEPFSGSGSTLIACEQLGRRCRAIEIDPGYVAVALQRWADATGKTPELIEAAPPSSPAGDLSSDEQADAADAKAGW